MRRTQFQNNLPQLKTSSQNKFRATSKGHSYTQQLRNESKMLTLRPQNSTSYASKVIKYETSGVIYLKRKEEEELRLRDIEHEIRAIQKQLEMRRGENIHQGKNADRFTIDYKMREEKEETKQGEEDRKHYKRRKIINLNDFKEVRGEIELTLKSIQYLKKKVNTMRSENAQIHGEVSKYRKEINTIKEHFANISRDLEEQDETYGLMLQENKVVNEEVARKHFELHQRKSDKAHEQTKKLKKYDEILKSITREIEDEKIKTATKPAFYMTEVNYSEVRSPARSPGKRSHSPSKRRLNIPLHELQSLLKSYEDQFQRIKEQAGTDNWQQIGEQYTEHQKQTYAIYRFTNGLSEQLREKIQQQQNLRRRLEQAKREIVFKYSSTRQAELDEVSQSLEVTRKNNKKFRQDSMMFSRILKDLKLSIPVMIDRLRMSATDYPELGEFNLNKLEEGDLIPLLIIIQKRKNELMENSGDSEGRTPKLSQYQVQEQIQNAKREFALLQKSENTKGKEPELRYEKFLDHSELMKTIDLTNRSKKEKRKN